MSLGHDFKPDLDGPLLTFNSIILNIFCDILDAVKKILMRETQEELQKKLRLI